MSINLGLWISLNTIVLETEMLLMVEWHIKWRDSLRIENISTSSPMLELFHYSRFCHDCKTFIKSISLTFHTITLLTNPHFISSKPSFSLQPYSPILHHGWISTTSSIISTTINSKLRTTTRSIERGASRTRSFYSYYTSRRSLWIDSGFWKSKAKWVWPY